MTAVVVAALIFWTCVFLIYFASQGISLLDFFAGSYEPYDPGLAEWRPVEGVTEPGQIVEERWILPDANARASYLEHQVRHRDAHTRAIVSVEPVRRVTRQRTRSVRGA
jgi:hypothetical protein